MMHDSCCINFFNNISSEWANKELFTSPLTRLASSHKCSAINTIFTVLHYSNIYPTQSSTFDPASCLYMYPCTLSILPSNRHEASVVPIPSACSRAVWQDVGRTDCLHTARPRVSSTLGYTVCVWTLAVSKWITSHVCDFLFFVSLTRATRKGCGLHFS